MTKLQTGIEIANIIVHCSVCLCVKFTSLGAGLLTHVSNFRLAVIVFRRRNRTAPEYLARDLQWSVDDDSRKRLRSASSHKLVVRRSILKTKGDRVFGVAAWSLEPLTSRRHLCTAFIDLRKLVEDTSIPIVF